jgi:uncharacterized protein (TIGR03086 family)
MPGPRPTASLVGAVGLLERAIGYTRMSLDGVTAELLGRPTPCRGWDLGTLLGHMDDSLAAFQEAAEVGVVELGPVPTPSGGDAGRSARRGVGADPELAVVDRLRDRACALLGAWTARAGSPAVPVRVAGSPLTSGVLVATGALEIAVHGWDVSCARGVARQLPPGLAQELLELAPLLVRPGDRPARFAAPAPVPLQAGPGERLLAFLGRRI